MSGARPTLTGRAAILVLVLAALVVTLAIPLRAWLSQQSEIAALETEVSQARERVEGLRAELEDWEDPAFVIGQARPEGEEIVIRTANLDYQMRWIFSEVTPRSFRWRAEVQFPDGWRVMLRMTGTRTED